MKITYELDSENPDHRADIEIMHNASNYWSALWDIDQKIRSFQKYSEDRTYESAAKVLDEVRSMIAESEIWKVN